MKIDNLEFLLEQLTIEVGSVLESNSHPKGSRATRGSMTRAKRNPFGCANLGKLRIATWFRVPLAGYRQLRIP